jgi:hypothetical protein
MNGEDSSAPVVRRSSNEQDARRSLREVAVQPRPRRSVVKALDVRTVEPSTVKPMIEGGHYLHSMPGGVLRCFGVYLQVVMALAGPPRSHENGAVACLTSALLGATRARLQV